MLDLRAQEHFARLPVRKIKCHLKILATQQCDVVMLAKLLRAISNLLGCIPYPSLRKPAMPKRILTQISIGSSIYGLFFRRCQTSHFVAG